MKDGSDVAIFATGLMIPEALKAADALEAKGISTAVVNFHTIKPFDTETALAYANKCKAVVTAEEHSIIGGLGGVTAETIAGKCSCKFDRVGIMDRFGQSGSRRSVQGVRFDRREHCSPCRGAAEVSVC